MRHDEALGAWLTVSKQQMMSVLSCKVPFLSWAPKTKPANRAGWVSLECRLDAEAQKKGLEKEQRKKKVETKVIGL